MSRSKLASWILLLTISPALVAQSQAGWDKVKQLPAGQEIRITLMDGRIRLGDFQSATDDALMFATSNSQEALGRTMVARVSARGKNHRLRNALIGLGAGAGTGLIVGAIGDAESCHPSLFLGCFLGPNIGKVVFTPVGALVGMTVGAVIPTGGWHDVYHLK